MSEETLSGHEGPHLHSRTVVDSPIKKGELVIEGDDVMGFAISTKDSDSCGWNDDGPVDWCDSLDEMNYWVWWCSKSPKRSFWMLRSLEDRSQDPPFCPGCGEAT